MRQKQGGECFCRFFQHGNIENLIVIKIRLLNYGAVFDTAQIRDLIRFRIDCLQPDGFFQTIQIFERIVFHINIG